MLALLLAALLGQTVYEWTDAQGGTHYTDDRSTIPSTAKKVRTTTGDDVSVLRLTNSAKPAPGQGAPPVAPAKNLCDEASARITALEAQRVALFKAYEARLSEAQAQCHAELVAHGHGAYAQCTASVQARIGSAPDETSLRRELDEAKEALRRAQVSGCTAR